MKKFRHYALLLFTAMAVFGCSKDYDDTELRNDVNDLKSRVEKLETWCATANSQISALQGLVAALEENDYVTGVSPVANGYTITFSKSNAITIYNGKDGAKGADGVTPVIGVNKDTDGVYYWTVKTGTAAATWMLGADGKKIRTTGNDGAEGKTPALSVATDTDGKVYWKVNGEWMLNNGKKVQATGDKGDKGDTGATGSAGAAGEDGADGDAVFAPNGVTVDKTKGTVTFTLAGEDATKFTLPMASEMKIFDSFAEYKVNSEKRELTLALNVKDGDYAAIKAELTSSMGMTTAIVKAATRAAATPWGVELTNPTFKADKTIDVNAKVTFILPAGIEEGEFALLKVTVVGKDGKEHAATRVIVYTIEVSVEAVALTDNSVSQEGTVKLVPTFTPTSATNQNVTWESSKPEIATIAADGTVTGVAMGETIITVTTIDGGFTATCKVTVTEKSAMPNFRIYGLKNNRLAYYDGKEVKILTEEEDTYLDYGAAMDNDLYGVSHDGTLFYKNDKVASKDGKIPSDISSVGDFRIVSGDFYVAGTNKAYTNIIIWKNGQKLFQSEKRGSMPKLCVVGNDVIWGMYCYENASILLFKNDTRLTEIERAYLKDIYMYNGKVYIIVSKDNNTKRYVYDGTSTNITEEVGANISYSNYSSSCFSGNSVYTIVNAGSTYNSYKNLDWSTPLPALTIPEGDPVICDVKYVAEKNSDIYTYGTSGNVEYPYYQKGYIWKNSADPIRLPIDTLNVVHQFK